VNQSETQRSKSEVVRSEHSAAGGFFVITALILIQVSRPPALKYPLSAYCGG